MQNNSDKNSRDVSEKTGETKLSRRDLFEFAGMAIAASALPPHFALAQQSAKTATSDVSPVMARLSAYMSEAGSRPLPAEAAEKTKEHILDTLAAMISGSILLPGRKGIEFARNYGGKPVSTVVASDILCGPIEAALANGLLAHSDETDDSHAPSQSHPGCGIIPAALAVAEMFGASGTRFIRAVALGYDVGTRVTMTLGAENFEVNSHWSTHTIAPLFGAAAACGCIANMDAHQMRLVLGYTAQQSSGLAAWHRDTQHIQKAFVFAGMPARGGVVSALLVHDGWTGVEDIFSGADNFFDAYNPHADPTGLVDNLGERFEILRSNIKKWPVGSPIQAALEAIVRLRKQHPFTAEEVRQVTVQLGTDEAAIVNDRKMPDICLQQMVAVMLMDNAVTFRSANDEARMKDPATLRQRAKVKLVSSQQLQRLMPLRVAIVDVTLTDGTHLTERVDDVPGTPRNPMSREEIAAKARDLIAPVIGETTASALIEKVLALENINDIRELRSLLQKS